MQHLPFAIGVSGPRRVGTHRAGLGLSPCRVSLDYPRQCLDGQVRNQCLFATDMSVVVCYIALSWPQLADTPTVWSLANYLSLLQLRFLISKIESNILSLIINLLEFL